ncbi:MAG: choice-of-anchor D domain-containing protein [bacterium]
MRIWLAILIAFFLGTTTLASAQAWKIATPHQVLPVPVDGTILPFPLVNLISGMKYRLHASGVASVSNTGDQADAAYYIKFGLGIAPNIVPVSLRVRNSVASEDWFYNFWTASAFQLAYQPGHVYDATVPSNGTPLSFRFQDTQLGDNTGDILIDVARETPGLAIENDTIYFGNVRVGIPLTRLDSIESYGLEGFKVRSVAMTGTSAANFSVASERVVPFTLLETTNEFRFTYSPSKNGADSAQFHIFSSNGFGADQERIIYLYGNGIGTNVTFTPDTLDFGSLRVGNVKTLPDTILNRGGASLNIISITPETPGSAFTVTGAPFTAFPAKNSEVQVSFLPTATTAYFEKFDVQVDDGSVLHFYARGYGGVPAVQLEKAELDFGQVILGQSRTLTDGFANIGSAPLNINATNNTNPTDYAINSNFLPSYEPGHGIGISVTFSPKVHVPNCGNHPGQLILSYDDGTSTTITFKGCDHKPLDVKLEISQLYSVPAGEDIEVSQNLVTLEDPLDSALSPVASMTERITYDPTLFDFIGAKKGQIINTPAWNMSAVPTSGAIDFTINSTTAHFAGGGPLLTLRFHAHGDDKVGQSTNLIQSLINFVNPLEPLAVTTPGKITISDFCSPVNLQSGTLVSSIEQNNPNPFNPTTQITYFVGNTTSENATPVTIKLYDQLGRFIKVLVDEMRTPGIYHYTCDGSALSSGAYNYIFKAGEIIERRTMMLVK